MLEKRVTLDRIEVLPESGSIQIRQRMSIVEIEEVPASADSGQETVSIIEHEISYTYHRYVLSKDADISNEDPRIQAVAAAAWNTK